ncbi:hypothetical protein CK203_026168 [Vitis vinifera]|uniref:Uncharacterized protein n=1 Tax=Vitis vinifera TaxID=29760 RepID=A0A438IJK2_VITVI|nr:hypothetical protein CK203_026168 [Vitis vinifera]
MAVTRLAAAAAAAAAAEAAAPVTAAANPTSMDLDLPVIQMNQHIASVTKLAMGRWLHCKIEWFHFGCVGVKERPKGACLDVDFDVILASFSLEPFFWIGGEGMNYGMLEIYLHITPISISDTC